jgi:hypothetical protein
VHEGIEVKLARHLWKAYIQLMQAEAAFRIQKDQSEDRVVT